MSRHRLVTAVLSLVALAALPAALAVRPDGQAERQRALHGVVWSSRLPAEGRSALLDGDRIFVRSAAETVLAVDRASGRLLWQARAPHGAGVLVPMRGQLLVAGADELRALDRESGRVLWARFFATGPSDVLAADRSGPGLLVRSLGRRSFAAMLAEDGGELWRVGASQGPYHVADGRLFALDARAVLRGFDLEDGRESFTAGFPDGYRLEAGGAVCPDESGRGCWQIGPGPGLRLRPPARGADPALVYAGPVRCDGRGCDVDLPGGTRRFEGHARFLPDELRVTRAAVGEACVGCLGAPQPAVYRIDSYAPDGERLLRTAFVRRLDAAEDAQGFVELSGDELLAAGWLEP
jgi:hypothetical protein